MAYSSVSVLEMRACRVFDNGSACRLRTGAMPVIQAN